MKSLIYPEALFIYNSESSMDTQFLVAGMARERPWRNPWEVFTVWVCGCSPPPPPPGVLGTGRPDIWEAGNVWP